MNDANAAALIQVLQQIALELAEANQRGTMPPMLVQAAPAVQTYTPAAAEARGAVSFAPLERWLCPEHPSAGTKTVPAGISRAGNPYPAFIACAQPYCPNKPPKGPAPERAIPPSQGVQTLPG